MGGGSIAADEYFPYHEKIDALRGLEGQAHPHREVQDKNCCICFLVLSIIAALLAFLLPWFQGDVYRLNHGMDYRGELCGVPGRVNAANKYLMFCGSKEKQPDNPGLPAQLQFSARTCVPSCPKSSTPIPLNETNPIQCLRKAYYHVNTSAPTKGADGVMQVGSFGLDIWQTVEGGDPYPSEEYAGMYCVPQDKWLRDSVVYGPLKSEAFVMKFAASFRHSWPVILFSAILASLLGFGYLSCLSVMAGPLIAMSYFVTIFLCGFMGIFFVIGAFAPSGDGEEHESWLTTFNPITHSILGLQGNITSFFVGVVFFVVAAGLYVAAMNTMEHIDKGIAPIWCAIECIFNSERTKGTNANNDVEWKKDKCKPSCILVETWFKSAWILVQIAISLAGLGLISTVGYLDRTNIVYNDAKIEGLEAKFSWYDSWWIAVFFYVCMCYWWLEVTIGIFQYSIVYAVCTWYFVPKETSMEAVPHVKLGSGMSRVSNLRMHGVDNTAGERPGVKVKNTAGTQEFVITQVGTKGPGGKDVAGNLPQEIHFGPTKNLVKPWQGYSYSCYKGNRLAISYNLGSIATAVFYNVPSRIPLTIALFIRSLVPLETQQLRKNFEDHETEPKAAFFSLLLLIAHQLEHGFGGFTKNIYCAMNLSGCNFKHAAHESQHHIEEAGGLVTFFHGCTALYEILGTIIIALIGGFSAMLFINQGWLCLGEVQDTFAMSLTATGVCGLIGYFYMALFNVTVDTVLYTFAWARSMGYNTHGKIGEKCCPPALADMFKSEFENTSGFSGPIKVGELGMGANTFANHHVWDAAKGLTKTALGTQVSEDKPLLASPRHH